MISLNGENSNSDIRSMLYNLQKIIAIGFKVYNERAVYFRKWVNEIVKEYTIKGFASDDEKLKNGGNKANINW